MSNLKDLRIVMNGPSSKETKVYLDDEDISGYLNGIDFHIDLDGPAFVTLHFVKFKVCAELKAKILTNLEEGDNGQSIS